MVGKSNIMLFSVLGYFTTALNIAHLYTQQRFTPQSASQKCTLHSTVLHPPSNTLPNRGKSNDQLHHSTSRFYLFLFLVYYSIVAMTCHSATPPPPPTAVLKHGPECQNQRVFNDL